jgi:hypothetical protein
MEGERVRKRDLRACIMQEEKELKSKEISR